MKVTDPKVYPQAPPPETPPGPSERLLSAEVPAELAGRRLDRVLAELFPEFSRTRLQAWIRDGRVRVNGRVTKPRDPVLGGDRLSVLALLEDRVEVRPQPIELAVIYEDEHLLVLNKPAGLVVHPAAGNPDGTLQNALLHRAPALAALPRAGIVHRLDKDTSGIMVVAQSALAHRRLVAALQARRVKREYQAVVSGLLTAGGTIDAPIGRHPTQRTRMAVHPLGKPAVTHFRVAERFRAHCLLHVQIETGRTHQIRVHMAHVRHPLFGDPVYGGRLRLPPRPGPELERALRAFRRQALHAWRLQLAHPATGVDLAWEAPPPADFAALLAVLRADAQESPDA